MRNYDYYKKMLKETMNTSVVKSALVRDLQVDCAGKFVTDKFWGRGKTYVNPNESSYGVSSGSASFTLHAIFDGNKTRTYTYPYSFGFLKDNEYDPKLKSICEAYIEIADKLYPLFIKVDKISERKHKELMEKLKAEKRRENAEARAVNKLKAIKVELDDADWSTAYGWLAKHIGPLRVEVPASKEKRFISAFGANALHTVIDDSRVTSGGYKMKFNWSVNIGLNGDLTNRPACLDQFLSEDKTHITSLNFVIDLVNNHGFNFAEKQDINEIRTFIANDDLIKFEQGYAA